MLRLRQIALVAADLAASEQELGAYLGAGVVFRDPGVATFGLHNALFLVGDQFIEIVAPTQDGTTAGRLLDKRGGDGGYMVILQTDDLAGMRKRFDENDVRVVFEAVQSGADGAAICGLHLHPKDVGSAIVSIDECAPVEGWLWAGDAWPETDPASRAEAIVGVVIQADEPLKTAERWAIILGVRSSPTATGADVELDDAVLSFVPVSDGRGPGVHGVILRAASATTPTFDQVVGTTFERRP